MCFLFSWPFLSLGRPGSDARFIREKVDNWVNDVADAAQQSWLSKVVDERDDLREPEDLEQRRK